MQSLARPQFSLALFPEDAPTVTAPVMEQSRTEVSLDDTPILPPHIAAGVWRGSEMGSVVTHTVPTGFSLLDGELPGGGWPCGAVTEILQPQPSVCEWRLLGPALARIAKKGGGPIIMIGPPLIPFLPGLSAYGVKEGNVIWVSADTPKERAWATEQVVKAQLLGGAVLSWLPQATAEQVRRLQVHAQSCSVPAFIFRPEIAQASTSSAPLRVLATLGQDWEINVHIVKRKGPAHDGTLRLQSVPSQLAAVLPPRLRQLDPTRPPAFAPSTVAKELVERPLIYSS